MAKDFRPEIEGYEAISREIEVLRKHGIDYALQKGKKTEVINRLHPTRLNLKVSEIIVETGSTTTLRLVSTDDPLPPFQAGQYINLFVTVGGVRTSRPYSISSSPGQTFYYDITVRRVPEGFVSDYLLDKVKAGDVFQSTSPIGNFHYNPLFHGKDLVFIAGGSGITPFMSMIREVTDADLDRRITLIYGCQSLDDVIFQAELEQRAQRHDQFSYHLVITNPPAGYQGLTGFIDAGIIKRVLGEGMTADKTFYLCGPQVMYDLVLAELSALGVSGRKIRKEVIAAPANIADQPGWPARVSPDTEFSVRVTGSGGIHTDIKARAGEPLMVSLERNGIVVPAGCRSGECSLCRVRLVSGTVFQPVGVLLRKSDRQFGYIHSCRAYPTADLEIVL
jgi:ferredoxin-NADP reductase/ferredoxin